MNVSVAAEHGIKGLYEMFRGAMEGHVNASRREAWNDARERKQFYEQLSVTSLRVVRVDDAIAGFIDFRRSSEGCHLHTMIIAPAWQSRGVGTIVLERLTTEAQALAQPLTVAVLKANPRARAFYERAGFSVTSSTESHDQLTWTGGAH
jgi:ribosomal protein S18 acetylase RimI-like enzyme